MTQPEAPVPKIFPDGHYYSPIPDWQQVRDASVAPCRALRQASPGAVRLEHGELQRERSGGAPERRVQNV